MAKELTITINVETGQATTNLRQVDAAMDKVAQHAGGPLNTSLDKLNGTTKALGGTTATATSSLTEFFGGMVAGMASATLIIAGLKMFVSQLLRTADELVRVSDRTGETIEGVQRLGAVAVQSGNNLGEITNAIGFLQDRLANGDKSALGAVKQLGLSFGELERASPEGAIKLIGAALQGVSDANERASIATDLFGRSGRAVLPTLLADYNTLAEAAGIMSEATVRKLDDIGDAWERLSGRVKAAGGEVAVTFAEVFEHPVAFFDMWIKTGDAAMAAAGTKMASAFRDQFIREMAKPLPTVGVKQITTASGVKVWAFDTTEIDKYIERVGVASRAIKPIALSQQEVAKVIDESNAFIRKSWDDTQKAAVESAKRAAAAFATLTEKVYSQEHQYDVDKLFRDMFANSKTWDEVAKELPPYIVTAIQKSVAEAQRQLDTMKPFDIMTILTGNAGNETLIGSTFAQRFKAVGAAIADVFRNINTTAGQIAQVATGTMNVWFDKTVTGAEKTAQKMVAVFAAAAQIISMLFGGSKGGQIASTAFGGAAAGAGIGFLFGGVLGAGIGAAIGGIAGLIGGIGAAAKTTRDANIAATAQIKELQKQLLTTYGSLAEVDKMSQQLGVDLVGAWGDKSQAGLAHFNALLDVFNAKLALAPTWDKATALMEKYGISIERAGQAIRQLMITDSARTLINDWQQWKSLIGDDTAAMEEFAKASASQFSMLVQQSAAYGTAIPENMKPMLEFLVKSGLLLDANGKAITDIAGITFGKAVQTEQEKLVASLDRLTAALIALTPQWGGGGGAGGGIDRVIGEQNARMLPPSFAGGTRGQYRDFGRGTLAVLHGRERVMTEGEGSGGSAPTIVIQALDSADVETWLRRGGAQKIAAAMVPVFPGAAKFRVGRR